MNIKGKIKTLLVRNPTKANYKFILKDWVRLSDLDAMSKVLETKRFSQNLDTIVMNRPNGNKILVISPHPDDDVLSSGGTLLKCIQSGAEVKVIYITSATNPTYQDEQEYVLTEPAQQRENETKRVAEQLGSSIEFWRYNKKNIPIDEDIMARLRNIIESFNPEVVFVPFIADDHEDHRRCSELLYRTFENKPQYSFEIWAYQVYTTVLPNVVVDITEVIDKKIHLINLWESQKSSRDWAHYTKGLNAFNCRLLKTNQARYAEAFFVVPISEYIKLCKKYYG